LLDVLVISPHPDDAELGMAGAILRCKADGLRVGILDLTSGEPTPEGSLDIRARETEAATRILHIDWRRNLGLPNRSLEATLEARRQVAGVIRLVKPRWLFAPYWVDAHPDHVAATELIEAGRFWAKLSKSDIPGEPHHPERVFHYFCVHLRLSVPPAFILDISPYWEQKRAAIECYHSQFTAGRKGDGPTIVDRLRDQAAYWGGLIGTLYGEPFASREPVGIASFRDLV
jgi:N-acetylglucosamine malate deacetylase 1